MSTKYLRPLSVSALGLLLSTAALAEAPAREGHIRDAESGQYVPVRYADDRGLAILEEDIVLGPTRLMEKAEERVRARAEQPGKGSSLDGMGILTIRQQWPGGVIPYTISPDLPRPERVTASIQQWQRRTGLRFVERTADNASRYPYYVSFTPGEEGCRSYVGRVGGEQPLTLADACRAGDVVHAIGHAIGLGHEQNAVVGGNLDGGAIEAVSSLYAR